MRQIKILNRSRTPIQRGQEQPIPTVIASGADVSELKDQADSNSNDISSQEDRIAALETLTEAQALVITGLLADMTAAQAEISDHETRITALETP